MSPVNFDITKFMHEYLPKTAKDCDLANNTRKSLKHLLALFDEKSGHVFSEFPLDLYDESSISRLLLFILEKKTESREAVSLLNNSGIDRNLLKTWNFENPEECQTSQMILAAFPDYQPIGIREFLFHNRRMIRLHARAPLSVLEELIKRNNRLYLSIYREEQLFKTAGLAAKNLAYLPDYLDYLINDTLQFIIYGVIANPAIPSEMKDFILTGLVEKIKEIDRLLSDQITKQTVHEIRIEEAFQLFLQYLTKRNEYTERLSIYAELQEEENKYPTLFTEVPNEFITEKLPQSYEPAHIREVLTEGKTIREYARKLDETKKMIRIFKDYGSRDIHPASLQDLKVHFCELFISNSKHHRKALTIAREYLYQCENQESIQVFEKTSEYLFLREKISRGYFREKNLLSFYHQKNEMEALLYPAVLKIWQIYDFNEILEFLCEINQLLLKTQLDSCKEYPITFLKKPIPRNENPNTLS